MTDALARLRKLAEGARDIDSRCTCEKCQAFRALPLLLDLVEAADRMRPYVDFDAAGQGSIGQDYDTARAALEKVGMG